MQGLRRISFGARRVAGTAALALLTALGGCASTMSAQVTSFQRWPADAFGQKYRIEPGATQSADDLEFQAVADMVRAAIGPTGLVESAAGQPARFSVSFQASSPVREVWVQRYADDFYPGFSPFFGYYGRGAGIFYSPPMVNVPVTAYQHTLTVSILDNAHGGAQVYRATAIHSSAQDNQIAIMPYLAQSLFDNFPGNNGQVREVRLKAD